MTRITQRLISRVRDFTLVVLLFNISARIFAQTCNDHINADTAYKELEEKFLYEFLKPKDRIFSYMSKSDSIIAEVSIREKLYSDYREKGLNLWTKFPHDIRRYEWFKKTLLHNRWGNRYWKSIEKGARSLVEEAGQEGGYSTPISWNELRHWENVYPHMLSEYKMYCERSGKMIEYNQVLVSILDSFLKLSLNSEYRYHKKLNLPELKRLFLPLGEKILGYDVKRYPNLMPLYLDLQNVMDAGFISNYRAYGLNEVDMDNFFVSLQTNSSPNVREWAERRNNIFLLMNNRDSFQLKSASIGGQEVDFGKMRGNVVLVDFWATWCSSCIERMPEIKRMYDKYKEGKFIVISACLNDERDLTQVKNIKSKIGADWLTLAIGKVSQKESLGSVIWEKYKFFGVPQLLLFNKKGKLVMINDLLRSGNFEPILKKLLEE
ncbi:TlpA family protein disulfide reductase [Chitinophaga niabensis]|uniref:Thioredoxin-like n=1 Tax=Chitinophaga niabensis TaxID=536979 RepID=A0A1N6JYA8_9BACT|nr:TlpA disulfide reductase family protein [Chitinophaga niabensis]SIO49318.1 Thioredoxin-like [Chitinophaga niabensis]